MVHEAGHGCGELHELALARLERQLETRAGGQRRAPRAGGDHDRAGLDRLAAGRPHAAAEDGLDGAALADLCARLLRLARERPRDRPRVALQVAGEVARTVQLAGQLGLERAHLVDGDEPRARDPEPLEPRGLVRPGRRVRVHDQRSLDTDPGLVAEPLGELAVERETGAGELQLRPRILVRAEHVALAQPGRAARDRAAVEQRDGDAAHSQLARDRRADDAGADHDDVASQAEACRERVVGVEQVLPHPGDPGAARDLGHDRRAARRPSSAPRSGP